MTDLITEARELCEKWSLSDYAVFECEDCIANMVIYKVVELCDALEKANEQNKRLVRELSELARESVEREKVLARLEAEVMAAIDAVPVVRCGECKHFMEYRSGFIPEVEKANGDCFIRLMNSGDKQFLAVKYSDYCSYGAKMEVKQ